MDAIELCYMPALELGEAIRAKKVSPVEVVDAVLARIERLNPTLNAYCTVTAAAARAAAKEAEAAVMRGDVLGTLHGIPVSIKDLVATKGVRTTHGSKLYEQFIPDEDAPVVERLKRAGAIILGKTNTPEFGHKAITDNLVFGAEPQPLEPGAYAGRIQRRRGSGSGDGAGTAGGGDRRGWIDPHSVELLCDLRAETDAGAGRHGPNLWWAGNTVAHGPDDSHGARCGVDAERHGGGRAPRSELPAGRWKPIISLASTEAFKDYAWRGARIGDMRPWTPEVRQLTAAAAQRFADLGCHVEEAHPGFDDPAETYQILSTANRAARVADRWPAARDRRRSLAGHPDRGGDALERGRFRPSLQCQAHAQRCVRAVFQPLRSPPDPHICGATAAVEGGSP